MAEVTYQLAVDATLLQEQVVQLMPLLDRLDQGLADRFRGRIADLCGSDLQIEVVPAVDATGLLACIRCDLLDELRAAALGALDCNGCEVRDA